MDHAIFKIFPFPDLGNDGVAKSSTKKNKNAKELKNTLFDPSSSSSMQLQCRRSTMARSKRSMACTPRNWSVRIPKTTGTKRTYTWKHGQKEQSRPWSREWRKKLEKIGGSKDRHPDRKPATHIRRKSPYGQSADERIQHIRRCNHQAKLLGRMKKKSLCPKPMDTERDKKRKESEPCIEVGDSLEDENAQTHLDLDPSDNARWMEDAMKKLKERTDDVSELETNMSGVQWNITEVGWKLDAVSDSFTQINEGNVARVKNQRHWLLQGRYGNEREKNRSQDGEHGKKPQRQDEWEIHRIWQENQSEQSRKWDATKN